MPRYLTSYLNHPLVVDSPPGVLRVQICRSLMHFQRERVDLDLSSYYAPTEEQSQRLRAGERVLPYDFHKNLEGQRTLREKVEETGAHTVLLLCHEADPSRCHRRYIWDATAPVESYRHWSLDHELASPHGGRAKLEGLDADC